MWNLPVTLISAAVGIGLTVLCGWRGARPPDVVRGPRMVPWRFLMLLSAAWVLLMVVHLFNLMGVETGR
ncbi:MAG TPA: hypothetical protein VF699_10080 [Caulobacteraceae bacterium]|jgi:hypothetical protein